MSNQENSKVDQAVKSESGQDNSGQFRCPCGKNYQNYPALYTHVKGKHDGKVTMNQTQPPGNIMKPKQEKTRGRPKLVLVENPDSDAPFDISEQFSNALMNTTQIEYNQTYEQSSGNSSCQDMGTKLKQQLSSLEKREIKFVDCYLNELKHFLNQKLGDNFWDSQSPEEIIDQINDFHGNHDKNKKEFPLEKETITQLSYIIFKWMNRNNWTPHKLIKISQHGSVLPLP